MVLTATFKPEHVKPLSDEELFMFCLDNKHLKIERNSQQQLLFMSPTGLATSAKNVELYGLFLEWNNISRTGIVFDSNAGFYLPNGALRSPDLAWMSKEKWNSIPDDEKEKFAHAVPEFVLELLSPSDQLKTTQDKMKEWIENGVQLAWLIDYKSKKAWIYRANNELEEVKGFNTILFGENILRGLEIDLALL